MRWEFESLLEYVREYTRAGDRVAKVAACKTAYSWFDSSSALCVPFVAQWQSAGM